MYKKNRALVFMFITVWMLSPNSSDVWSQSVDDIMMMTENYPPYNFSQDNKLQGISVDLMEAMLKKTGSAKTRKDMHLLPWARGYYYLQNENSNCLFATTRTEEREKLFRWVGPICDTTIVLTSRKDRKVFIKTADDLKKYRIGAVIKDIGEQLLLEAGLTAKEIDTTGGSKAIFKSIKKMNIDRMDAFAYEENVIKWELKRQGFDINQYETVYVLQTGELYYAFHKDTPDDIVNAFQHALNELKREGEYLKIKNAYLK